MSIAGDLEALREIKPARILQIDIETAPSLAFVWSIWQENIPLDRLIVPGEMICFAAKWYGEDEVILASDYHDGHKTMVALAHRLYTEADVVATYNGPNFDNKHVAREFVLAQLPPPSPYRDIDLLAVVRQRFKFQSNKLDFVAEQLGLGKKVKHRGFELWRDCLTGDSDSKALAWREMREYNIGDVLLQERLLDRLRPWIKNHPVIFPTSESDTLNCTRCGSENLTAFGTTSTNASVFPLYQCQDCFGWVRHAKKVAKVGNTRSV